MALKKATGKTTPGDVSAAHQFFEDNAAKSLKHHGALKAHIDALEDDNVELAAKLADSETAREAEARAAAERHARDTTALQSRVNALEEKLRKVQATLA